MRSCLSMSTYIREGAVSISPCMAVLCQSLHPRIPTMPGRSTSVLHRPGEGGGVMNCDFCLGHLNIHHAYLSRWSTAPTPSRLLVDTPPTSGSTHTLPPSLSPYIPYTTTCFGVHTTGATADQGIQHGVVLVCPHIQGVQIKRQGVQQSRVERLRC